MLNTFTEENPLEIRNKTMIELTYSELKTLRDSLCLIPGQQYRITDYITTTTQENTISAGHQFDIIITADSDKDALVIVALNEYKMKKEK